MVELCLWLLRICTKSLPLEHRLCHRDVSTHMLRTPRATHDASQFECTLLVDSSSFSGRGCAEDDLGTSMITSACGSAPRRTARMAGSTPELKVIPPAGLAKSCSIRSTFWARLLHSMPCTQENIMSALMQIFGCSQGTCSTWLASFISASRLSERPLSK
eukprot:SAG31_NODE_3353_length_4370_cov_1.783423_3_plen_160_part_00